MLYGILNPTVEDAEDDEDLSNVQLPPEVGTLLRLFVRCGLGVKV